MKELNFTRILFLITSLFILIAGFFMSSEKLITSIVGTLIIISLVVLDIEAPKIAKLSEGNPKVKTIRFLNRITLLIIVICTIFALLTPIKTPFSSKTNEILITALISIFMMIFGNVSPKIPFNRYVGLRLPWTIRDEQTWKIAHKIIGYLSFPVALGMFGLVFFFSIDRIMVIGILSWVIIPSVFSLIFYYKKMKGINI